MGLQRVQQRSGASDFGQLRPYGRDRAPVSGVPNMADFALQSGDLGFVLENVCRAHLFGVEIAVAILRQPLISA